MRSLALANQKGGVGKTTTAVHLAHGLTMVGARVVLVDLDPQGNATVALQNMGRHDGGAVDEPPLPFLETVGPGFFLVPSPGADRNLERDASLDGDALAAMVTDLERAGMDWLLVDCPPRMDAWGWTGLRLCQQVLVPVQLEFFAIHGLSQMMATLEEAREAYPGRAELLGVVANLVDVREPVELEVLEDLRKNLGPKMLDTRIYRDSQLVEAASHGLTAFDYNPFSKGARSFGELVREVAGNGGS